MKRCISLLCFGSTLILSPLSAEKKVLALAGSTREDSYNKQLIAEATAIASKMGAVVTIIDLKDYPMPFYNADLERAKGMPEEAKKFRRLFIENEAIIIASPEYNGSFPAVLKNALDWASRSEEGGPSREAFIGKTFAIMSTSPGGGGGSRGLIHLRSVIEAIGGFVVSKQVAIPNAHHYFSEAKRSENLSIKEEIQQIFE